MISRILWAAAISAATITSSASAYPGPLPLPNCPIMDEPINLAVSADSPDGPVFFCCEGCIKKYQKGPQKYASKVAQQRTALAKRPRVQTRCPVSKQPINSKVFIGSGSEKVYLCCKDCVSKYREAPQKYAAALANSYTYQTTCPVMGQPIDPTSFTKLADGRSIYYCCDGCEGKLFTNPAKYAKQLADQGYQYNWAKIKKAGAAGGGHPQGGHDHSGHGHDHGHGHGHDHGSHDHDDHDH